MRPIIGINSTLVREPNEPDLIAVRQTYVDSVLRAGGVPVILPAISDAEAVARHVESCNGFVFIGGPDINPSRYGQDAHPTISRAPQRREDYDFALITAVMAARKPFLAICLGCQEVNVALGGDLIQDIVSEVPGAQRHALKQHPHFARHEVNVQPGSRLHALVGSTRLNTNSSHHQAVRTPAPGLRITATADDGIVEALEAAQYPFGLAIQWHPEHLISEQQHLRLFEGLVEAATPPAE